MRSYTVMLTAALLMASPALYAQQGRQPRQAQGGGGEGAEPRAAVPRGGDSNRGASPGPATPAAGPRGGRPEANAGDGQRARGDGGQRRADGGDREAAPRGSRPRGDNPETGVAVPRGTRTPRDGGSGTIYAPGRNASRNNFYYPRRYYPYGYGTFGLGYYYYDPFYWDPYYGGYGYGGYGYGGGRFSGYGYGYPTGELRLQVDPKQAEVYVDGYYAGSVDDFDGVFQSLTLEEGQYEIEVAAQGYEPLTFKVRITPGRKVTYRGELLPQRP